MKDSWNLDKLSFTEQCLIAYMFNYVMIGWTLCYMVEVRLANSFRNLLEGGKNNLIVHGGNGSKDYADHYGNDEWAVIHCDDEAFKSLGITDVDITRAIASVTVETN